MAVDNTKDVMAAQKLMLLMARHGITEPAEVEATKQKIIAEMPPALLAEMGDASDAEKAMAGAEAYFAAIGVVPPADPTQKKATAPQDFNMTAEEQVAIDNWMGLHAAENGNRAAHTRVVNVLTDKPILAAIHVPNARLIPSIGEKTEANFAKWESQLVDTPENRQAFAELKATFMKKEEMEVFINPDAREKTIGWAISTIDAQGNPINQNLTKETAIAFLLVKVQGVIPPRGENSVGIRIKWTARKQAVSGDNENNSSTKGTTSVTLLNRKALQNNSQLSVCTCVIQEAGGQKVINEQYSAKTAKYFEIVTDRTNSKGNPINKKVRLPGKTQVYKVMRLEQYVNDFGAAERQKGSGMTKAERQKVNEAVMKSLQTLKSDPTVENNELRTALAEIRTGATKTATNFN